MIPHLALAFLITLALAAGLYGLGDWVRPRGSAGVRWAFGWMAMWWGIAVPAQIVGPRSGVAVGAALAIAGLVRLLSRSRESQRTLAAGAVGAMIGAPLWLVPPHFFDALVYHLGLPWSWLVNGSYSPIDHNLFSHFPLAASTVFLLPVAAGVPEAAAGLHWLTFISVLASSVALARNLGAERWAWASAAALLGTWHAPWLASLAGADHLVVLGIVVAAEILTGPEGDGARGWIDPGIALGLSLSAKYTGAVPVAAMLSAALLMRKPRWHAIAAGATALAASSFWWIRNLLEVGNPFHPLFWNVFGGPGWTAEEYAHYSRLVQEGVGGPRSWLAGIAKLVLPSGLGVWLGLATLIALVAVVSKRREPMRAPMVLTAAALTVAGWAVTSQTTRYALPAAALVSALMATGLALLAPWLTRVSGALLAIAVGHGLLTLGFFLFGTLGIQRAWYGADARERWRHAVTLNDPSAAYAASDSLLPKDAHILIVGEGRPWLCPRPHYASSPYDTQWLQAVVERSATAEEVRATVRAAGWTHLLINWAEVNRLGGEDYRVLRWTTPEARERWLEFGNALTEGAWAQGSLEIRAIRR